MYSAWSLASRVRVPPRASTCRRATFSSRILGSWCTPIGYWSALVNSSICAITWSEKLLDITNDGCPVALPRLSRRPSESTMIERPSSSKTNSSTCGLMLMRVTPSADSSPAMSISLSKWPMLPRMALFFIRFMCSKVMMSLLPVAVMTMSASAMASSTVTTSNPSIIACSALIGSISVTCTRAP